MVMRWPEDEHTFPAPHILIAISVALYRTRPSGDISPLNINAVCRVRNLHLCRINVFVRICHDVPAEPVPCVSAPQKQVSPIPDISQPPVLVYGETSSLLLCNHLGELVMYNYWRLKRNWRAVNRPDLEYQH